MRLTGLHHVTLICRDLDRTTAFYRDLFGLRLAIQSRNDDDPDCVTSGSRTSRGPRAR